MAILVNANLLTGLFGVVLIYVVYSMRRLPREDQSVGLTGLLDTNFIDPFTGQVVAYYLCHLD